jgi:putative methionine-R-sulfoxide reductase with GAF domain
VVPVVRDGKVIGVLDADSENLNHFDETDQNYLEQIIDLISFYNVTSGSSPNEREGQPEIS